MIKYFQFFLFFLYSLCSNAQHQQINFDDDWKFAFGHASNPEKDFNYSIKTIFSKSGNSIETAADIKFQDSKWRTLNLPHDWAVELPFVNIDNFDVQSHGYKPVGGLFPETSIGWYRKHFRIEAKDSGQRFQIQFDGVFRDANFWINGFYLGNNKSGYIGANYDITDFINYNDDNVICVRVDATQYEGWFYEGAGIYRHVWLHQYQNTHIATDGVFAISSINNNIASLQVATTIQNDGNNNSNYSIKTYVADRNGKLIAATKEEPISINILQEKTVSQSIQISNPILWNLDNPYLYRVVVELKENGKLIDSKKIRFGFRTIEIKTNGVFLNGNHIKILGTNNHQDHAGVGSALPDYLQYYRIGLLKSMGSNAYRTSHHAPTPELLDACDSLGMLVMDEQRLLNSAPEYMNQFERLVKRDRNHPSIFMWSIGNEEGLIHTKSNGKRIAQTFIQKLKQLDPTRTCTYAADLGNVFKGVNEVIPVRSFNYRETTVADYHRDHPNQPILGTEMGSTVTTRGILQNDSIRSYLIDQDVSFPWWASTAEKWWNLAAPNDYWLGGFIWTGFDYRGEPTPFKWPNINSHFGVMDMCGFPKNIYYYYKSWWTNQDVLHISPHWNHHNEWGKPKKEIDVWVNSNADNVELFLNGKSLGKKDMPRYSHLQWKVPFEPGKLEAIAYKNGRKLSSKIETTSAPFEVVVTPYKTTILADGKDATILNISVVDKEGREVPDASNMIQFKIVGPGKIIGVGNGDPSSHEPDQCIEGAWQRSLFNGKCQVIVQSTNEAGFIQFEANSSNLYKGATDIITVNPKNIETITIDENYILKGEAAKPRKVDEMLGADISFLPELEARGVKFSDKGIEKSAIEILKDHGFNYVRLRIFNNPSTDSGYSPKKGFCDLNYTLKMAKRVKDAGLKLLLDFHYSDYWADPGKQYKPAAWRNLSFSELKKALYNYTKNVLEELKAQGTTPDMVQVGNEINHGIVWPDGNVQNMNQTAQLFNAGVAAVKAVDPTIQIMLHVALGGQNHESVFFIDNMIARVAHFDVIGQSYYPKWHGTLSDLENNLNDLIRRYNKDVIVVEYSALKNEVNKIAFELPNKKGKGTCIWEPLNTWEKIFENDGKSNDLLLMYDEFSKMFLNKN
ncbi:MAG: glycosyl hydrolase 53 family protein [Chitinophagaceae bacterium]|nr:glycosyl hydrolase 53 family protein [Chitinophagaceae bacterium]